jgi:mRNA interferase MazF
MKRGEIWLVNLDPTIGAEIKKSRPAIVINNDELGRLPLRVIVPITEWNNDYAVAEWMVKLIPDVANGLSKTSAADCFQIRSVSKTRMVKRMGVVRDDILYSVEIALSKVLKIRDLE